jgi:hypothetical protein
MKTDQRGWNGCAHVVCTSGANGQAFQKRNDFWNDVQEVPAKRPFQVERIAQGDPTFGVSLGADSAPFRSTSSPIGEPRNGSTTDLNLKRCSHLQADCRALYGQGVCVPPRDGGLREKVEVEAKATRLPRPRISVISDKRISR